MEADFDPGRWVVGAGSGMAEVFALAVVGYSLVVGRSCFAGCSCSVGSAYSEAGSACSADFVAEAVAVGCSFDSAAGFVGADIGYFPENQPDFDIVAAEHSCTAALKCSADSADSAGSVG